MFWLLLLGIIVVVGIALPLFYRHRKNFKDRADQARLADMQAREELYYGDLTPEFGKSRLIERHKFEFDLRREPLEVRIKGINCRFPNLEDQLDGTVGEIDRVGKVLAGKHPHYSFGDPRMEDGWLCVPIVYKQTTGDGTPLEV